MKKLVVIIFLTSGLMRGQDLLIIPYAHYAGQAHGLFLKAPDKSLTAIQDSLKKGEDRTARAAKAFSLQTRALWGKYEKDDNQFYKRRPSKNDYYQSVSFITEKLGEAVDKGLVMKTDKCILWFVEVPYIQSEWVQKAPHLSEGLESWFSYHQPAWVKLQALFEQKGNEWVVRKRITGAFGQLNMLVKERLDQFGKYNAEGLSSVLKAKSAFNRVLERSVYRHRRNTSSQGSAYSPIYGSRLRRSRRVNR